MIHGPSLAIGAGLASVAIVVSFLVFNSILNESELKIESETSSDVFPNSLFSALLENGPPVLGNHNAPIVLIEFGDYQCHFCNVHFHNTEHLLLENYIEKGKVKMIFKDFTIIGPDSINAAHGAHCANDQNKFWEYHDILYNNWTGENNGWASSENLQSFAEEIGLNVDEWMQCMKEARHSEVISKSKQDGRDLGITGTPAFFVIGPDNKITKIFGAKPFESFEQIFNSELEKVS